MRHPAGLRTAPVFGFLPFYILTRNRMPNGCSISEINQQLASHFSDNLCLPRNVIPSIPLIMTNLLASTYDPAARNQVIVTMAGTHL